MDGWMGTWGLVLHTLNTFGVDRNEAGEICWWGDPPAFFMGVSEENAEVVVSARAEVAIGGRRVPVIGLLGQTSYGMKSVVIY